MWGDLLESSRGLWDWLAFTGLVTTLLVADLRAHRERRRDTHARALAWTILWVAVGLLFTFYVWTRMGRDSAEEYLAAFFIEKSLSLDNLFVFLVVFKSLEIPESHQRVALTWGVLGAVVFRGVFVFLGAAALRHWHWVEFLFGGILILAAWHALRHDPASTRENAVVEWLARHLPVTRERSRARFFIHENGRWAATPLLVAVIALELIDVVFAIDSVPAAFSVSRDEFVVYSSNVFAILGLRSLYVVLAKSLSKLEYLHYGLSVVLAFAGAKLVATRWIEISPLVSLAVIVVAVGAAIAASLLVRQREQRA